MMKTTATLSLIIALSASGIALAQPGEMNGMKDQGMKCMDMKGMKGMEGMDMKNMDMDKCMKMMGGSDKAAAGEVHETSAVVKKADPEKGTVTLAHEPVGTLSWPAMTMAFQVKDKALFDKLNTGKKVDVEFVKDSTDYVVTSVK
jgi:Cu(I)/Ag(I) efflux system protein CusF